MLERLGERESGTAGGGGLSRGAAGTPARAGAPRLGDDAEQPWQRAGSTGRAAERHGTAGGGGMGCMFDSCRLCLAAGAGSQCAVAS